MNEQTTKSWDEGKEDHDTSEKFKYIFDVYIKAMNKWAIKPQEPKRSQLVTQTQINE